MKKWLWIPVLVLLLFLLCCQKQEEVKQMDTAEKSGGEEMAAIAQTLTNNLDQAIENLENGQVSEGAGLLLDSVLFVKPHDRWPEGFADNIAAAKENFNKGNFSGAVDKVTLALDLIKQPTETEPATEGGETVPLAEIVKEKIVESKEEFQKGRADQGVIRILEALQLFAPTTK